MHIPDKWKWLRKTRIMIFLNRYHYQHHTDPRTNLNIIIPIADYVWGTKRGLPKAQQVIADNVEHAQKA